MFRLFAAATDGLPADARGLLPGLVLGDTSRTLPDLDEAMLATGMTHLSAVSGSNVAIVLAAAWGWPAFSGCGGAGDRHWPLCSSAGSSCSSVRSRAWFGPRRWAAAGCSA